MQINKLELDVKTSSLKTCAEISSWWITRFQGAVCVCINQPTSGAEAADVLHAHILRELVVVVGAAEHFRCLAELVIPELERQSYASHTNADENDDEHTANVLN